VLDGTDQDTVTCPSPRATEIPAGALGTAAGVTSTVDADKGPVPAAFTAATLNVYAVPFTKPEITWDTAVDANETDV